MAAKKLSSPNCLPVLTVSRTSASALVERALAVHTIQLLALQCISNGSEKAW
jgi:hypothetical protein